MHCACTDSHTFAIYVWWNLLVSNIEYTWISYIYSCVSYTHFLLLLLFYFCFSSIGVNIVNVDVYEFWSIGFYARLSIAPKYGFENEWKLQTCLQSRWNTHTQISCVTQNIRTNQSNHICMLYKHYICMKLWKQTAT